MTLQPTEIRRSQAWHRPCSTRAVMAISEHREFERTSVTSPARFWEWNRLHQAQAVELSAGGVFLRTLEALPEGAHLTVRLEVPGQGALTVLGEVVRTVKGGVLAAAGMGVRFLDLLPSQRRLILDFVASRQAA